MKSILLSIVLLCSSLFAQTSDVDTNGLTAEQKARIQIQVEQMKQEKDKTKMVDTAKEYVQLGEMIGKALGSCAKELNVQVNEFIITPAGMLTIGIICWKTVGRDVVHFGFGLCFLILGVLIWYRCAYLPMRISNVEYGQGFWIFRSKKVTMKAMSSITEGEAIAATVFIIIVVGVSQIIMWT